MTKIQNHNLALAFRAEFGAWDFHMLSTLVAVLETAEDAKAIAAITRNNEDSNSENIQKRSYRNRRCQHVGVTGLGAEARCTEDVNIYNLDTVPVCETCNRGNGPVITSEGRRILGADYHARQVAEANRIAEVMARR